MEKTSIVKQAKYLQKTWQNDYGTFHVHGIAFENGDFGEYSSKDMVQSKFIEGQPASYEISGEPGRHKIKPFNPQPDFQPNKSGFKKEGPKDRNRSFALAYAKDLHCALSKELDTMQILELAETFETWLNRDDAADPGLPPTNEPTDKLPF